MVSVSVSLTHHLGPSRQAGAAKRPWQTSRSRSLARRATCLPEDPACQARAAPHLLVAEGLAVAGAAAVFAAVAEMAEVLVLVVVAVAVAIVAEAEQRQQQEPEPDPQQDQ